MNARHQSNPNRFEVGFRCWVEMGGQVVMGRGRAELLERIARLRSISAAAREMQMSYRRAWLLVQSINAAAGEAVVITAAGGKNGGGAELTPTGLNLIAMFRRIDAELHETAAKALVRDSAEVGAVSSRSSRRSTPRSTGKSKRAPHRR